MSSTQSSSNMSHNSQPACLDPLESLIDFSEYETVSYQSPSTSPSTTKSQFTTRSVSNTPALLPSQQTLSGPSHNYDLYKQQTGIPQGAVANTLAVNSSNAHISQYGFNDSYFSGLSPNEEFLDFGSAPETFNDLDMDFESQDIKPPFFFPETNEYIDPSTIGSTSLPAAPVLPTQTSNVGRLWPGMHQQQAAMAKAQAQQKQQQQIIQQQRQSSVASSKPSQRSKPSHPPTDPIVEEKISQLLNSMRQSSVATESDHSTDNHLPSLSKSRKDEEDMDEDERLLASEEGKKLSSKERRQLRNKVSARAFRSRRKEYIGQLEGEIAAKVNENADLRSQNRALMEENTRLSDLTRMLLSSPSFSGFLDTLSQNPAAQQPQPQPQPRAAPVQQQERKVRKDANPYSAQQQVQQHIGMAMIPEHTMEYSMLDLNNEGGFSYQPQVFSVLSLPEPVIDSEILSGKSSFTSILPSDDEKVELPTVERAPAVVVIEEDKAEVEEKVEVVDEEFDSDPTFALYASSPAPTTVTKQELNIAALVSALPSKPVQYDLIVESNVDEAEAAMRKVDRICENLDRMLLNLSFR